MQVQSAEGRAAKRGVQETRNGASSGPLPAGLCVQGLFLSTLCLDTCARPTGTLTWSLRSRVLLGLSFVTDDRCCG